MLWNSKSVLRHREKWPMNDKQEGSAHTRWETTVEEQTMRNGDRSKGDEWHNPLKLIKQNFFFHVAIQIKPSHVLHWGHQQIFQQPVYYHQQSRLQPQFPQLHPSPDPCQVCFAIFPCLFHTLTDGLCRDGYIIELINISNINNIYAKTGTQAQHH